MNKNLYQKYRPKNLDEVVGQEYIKKVLENSIKQDQIQSTYLFNGPRGTGKTSIARIFAKLVNCDSKDNPGKDNCDTCQYFLENKEYDDIFELDGASNNSVDDIRKIIDNVKYQPVRLKKKVYIIDEVHMLSKGAFNALLKTLEEPQKKAIFILATTEVGKIPPTILSRCQRFDFGRIPPNLLKEQFKNILKKENIEYDEEILEPIVAMSDGCLRDGLSLLQKVITTTDQKIDMQITNDSLGLVNNQSYEDIYKLIKDKNTKKVLDYWNTLYMTGIDISSFILGFQVFLKNKILESDEDLELINIIYKINDIEQRAVYTQNLNNLMEVLFLQLTSTKKIIALESQVVEKSKAQIQSNNSNLTSKDLQENYQMQNEKIKPKVNKNPKIESKDIKISSTKIINTKMDDKLIEDIFEILESASKDIRVQMNKKFETIGNELLNNKKYGLAKFFLETNLKAASNKGVVVSIEEDLKESFINRKDKLYEIVEEEIKIKIISNKEWEDIKILYMSKIKSKSHKNNIDKNNTNEKDLEVVRKIEDKLKKKIKIIEE